MFKVEFLTSTAIPTLEILAGRGFSRRAASLADFDDVRFREFCGSATTAAFHETERRPNPRCEATREKNHGLLAKRVETVERGVVGQFLIPESRFFASLQILALQRRGPQEYGALDDVQRKSSERLVEMWQTRMASDSNQCPANFLQFYELVEGELARNRHDIPAAIRHYETAIANTSQYRLLDKRALAHQLFAEFWLDLGAKKTAELHLENAYMLFREWGATAVTRTLEKRLRELSLTWQPPPPARQQHPPPITPLSS